MVTNEGTRAYELQAQSVQNLSQVVTTDLFAVIRDEVQLVRLEARERVSNLLRAWLNVALTGLCTLLALGCLSVAIIAALSTVMPLWAVALIVGALFAIGAVSLGMGARAMVARAFGSPRSLDRLFGNVAETTTREEAERRLESSQQKLDRTVAAITAKTDSPSPMRDAALWGVGITLGLFLSARNKARG